MARTLATSSQRASAREPEILAQALAGAVSFHRNGKLAEASSLYGGILKVKPDHFDALHLLGVIRQQQGESAEALRLIDAALKVAPGSADAWSNRGVALKALERPGEALASYDRALAIDPSQSDAHANRARLLAALDRFEEALASSVKALALDPAHCTALVVHGNCLVKLGQADVALADYDRALALRPNDAEVLNNRGIALCAVNRCQEAVENFGSALALSPENAEIEYNRSLAHLALGDFSTGWRGYEKRWRTPRWVARQRYFSAPRWFGDAPVEGRAILLHAEQGFGDTLHFVRYAPLLAQRGAKVIVEAQKPLAPLLAELSSIEMIASGERLPPFDLHCPLMSLPAAFGTELASIPADIPYLRAPEARIGKWRERLGEARAFRVGINWAGSATHQNDRNRSLPLHLLTPLLATPGIEFVSLQRNLSRADSAVLRAQANVIDVGDDLADFADTAALLSLVDLVVSADTAIAHLAGAMGRPVFILLPFAPDFRWMLDRDDSPWYPTARLFRQTTLGDWDGPLARVRSAMSERAAG